ncbi:MAG: ATP-NAD kinase family protein [Hahellaceae bacterium]|nr:ATP-NAD kinase family protein [Hahellaceae bacterium]
MLKLGLLLNPIAGMGGPAALKGSDDSLTVAVARRLGIESKVRSRVDQFLAELARLDCLHQIDLYSSEGAMGVSAVDAGTGQWHRGFAISGDLNDSCVTTAKDTMLAAQSLLSLGVDLILFAGGDGTARDVCSVVGDTVPVLGLPSGVKMHSGVFATSPSSAAAVIHAMISGALVTVQLAEVRDIDESALKKGIVNSRIYGELRVPQFGNLVQQVKCAVLDQDELVANEIAAEVADHYDADVIYLVGAGRTTKALKDLWGGQGTLLGVDAFKEGSLIARDLNEPALYELVKNEPARLVISTTGGQGFLFGRGNQQLSARVLQAIGLSNIMIVSSRAKLHRLEKRPLLVDTGDNKMDQALCGYRTIITGYQDFVLYPVAHQ